jgi:hypothetical protein
MTIKSLNKDGSAAIFPTRRKLFFPHRDSAEAESQWKGMLIEIKNN